MDSSAGRCHRQKLFLPLRQHIFPAADDVVDHVVERCKPRIRRHTASQGLRIHGGQLRQEKRQRLLHAEQQALRPVIHRLIFCRSIVQILLHMRIHIHLLQRTVKLLIKQQRRFELPILLAYARKMPPFLRSSAGHAQNPAPTARHRRKYRSFARRTVPESFLSCSHPSASLLRIKSPRPCAAGFPRTPGNMPYHAPHIPDTGFPDESFSLCPGQTARTAARGSPAPSSGSPHDSPCAGISRITRHDTPPAVRGNG